MRPAALAAAFATLAFLLAAAGGCGRGINPAEWVRSCGQAVSDYAAAGGYVRFRQESRNTVQTDRGALEDWLRVEGDIILPDREKYECREELSSTGKPGETSASSFSYLTVDGGKTAYVAGESLSAELGVSGWVHYTPPEGQNRLFDYVKFMRKITMMSGSAEWVGYEEIGGVRCAHLTLGVSGREMFDLLLQEDPALSEKFPDLEEQEFTGEMRVRLWVAAEGHLPVRVIMETSTGGGGEVTTAGRLELLFSGYHEEPPSPIEAPAAFTEAR